MKVQEIIFGGAKYIMGHFEGFFERSRPHRKIPRNASLCDKN
jgi:hypothetical protein